VVSKGISMRVPPRFKLRQFSAAQIALAVCLGGVTLWSMSLESFPLALKIALGLVGVGLALAILFVEAQGVPLHLWAVNKIRYWVRSRRYIWRRGAPADIVSAVISLVPRPGKLQRAWRFVSHYAGVGLAVSLALLILFLLYQTVIFGLQFQKAMSVFAERVTPVVSPTAPPPLPTAMAQPTGTPAATSTPTPTPSPHGPLRVIAGWQCPTVLPGQGINTALYLTAQQPGAWVQVLAAYENGEQSLGGFQLPEGRAAIAAMSPAFVPLAAAEVQSNASIMVECRAVHWNRWGATGPAPANAKVWWFPRAAWPGVRLWFFEIVLPAPASVRLSIVRGDQILYERDYAPDRSGKVFLDALAQTKASEPGAGYLLQSETAFVASPVWH
jgi:hypothetical protein